MHTKQVPNKPSKYAFSNASYYFRARYGILVKAVSVRMYQKSLVIDVNLIG